MSLIPNSLRGYVVLLVALAAVLIIWLAMTGPGIALGLILVAAAGIILYYLAFRTDRWMKGEGF